MLTKKIITLILVILTILVDGCSILIKNDQFSSSNFVIKNKNEKLICDENRTKKQIVTLNSSVVNSFNELTDTLIMQNIRLSFIENAIILALLEMNARPDSNSPSARLDVIYTDKNGPLYWDLYSEKFENEFSYLAGLETLLLYYKAKYSLLELASFIDKYLNTPILADEQLANFLKQYKGNLFASPILKKAFIKGDDSLMSGEKIPKINFKDLITNYKKTKNNSHYKSSNYLFDVTSILENKKNLNIESADTNNLFCNLDISEHKKTILKKNHPILSSNGFGLIDKDQSIFFISSQLPSSFNGELGEFFIGGKTNLKTNCICVLKNSEKNRFINFISFNDKDPSQHLFHLFKQSGDNLTEKNYLVKALEKARYILLTNPTRLIFESRRGDEALLNQLQHLTFPIYHTEHLGVIWANYFSLNPTQSSIDNVFLIDDRIKTELYCK